MKIFAKFTFVVCSVCTFAIAAAAPPDAPASEVAIYGGGAFLRQYSGGGYDYGNGNGYGYGYDYGGPYYRASDTYSGVELGFDARVALPLGLLIDLSGEQARVSDNGDAFKEQQLTAGVGYTGRIGRRSSWYAEGFYEHYRLGEDFDGCSYSCNGWFNANGGGVKGGFKWRFTQAWFGEFGARVSYLSGQSTDLVQAKLDGSIGYLFTEQVSLSIGVSSQALEQTNDRYYHDGYGYAYNDRSNDVLGHTAVFGKLAVHF
jgi:hypothetical protein